jgi:hypothetical protein
VKKKVPVVTLPERAEEAARLAGLASQATLAFGDVAGAIKEGFLAFCCSAGMLAVVSVMEEEMTARIGAKGRHDPDRLATRNGSAPGSVVLGGRTVPLRRPRATLSDGGELALDSYALFSARDLLDQLTMERMLARAVGEQRCADCSVFMRRLGLGGLCPCCDEPVTVDELLGT